MDKTRGIITGSLVVTLIIGTLNSIYKTDKMPSFRFFFGSGILYLFLAGLADFEEEIAKALALAILTFTLLGDGGGVLDHFMGSGASSGPLNTQPKATANGGPQVKTNGDTVTRSTNGVTIQRANNGMPTTVVVPGMTGSKPIVPNGVVSHLF